MTAWSFAPWLIALLIAAGLGAFGWFSDVRNRRNRENEADHVSSQEDN